MIKQLRQFQIMNDASSSYNIIVDDDTLVFFHLSPRSRGDAGQFQFADLKFPET